MIRKQCFNSGRIWLNVYETDDGHDIVTITKSFKRNGEWQSTPFFNVNWGEIADVKKVIDQYEKSVKEVVVQ